MIPLEIYSHFTNKSTKKQYYKIEEKPKGKKVIVVVVHKFPTVFHLFS